MEGLQTVRVHHCQSAFLQRFRKLQDNHTEVWFMYLVTQRWFASRVDFLLFLFSASIAYAAVLAKEGTYYYNIKFLLFCLNLSKKFWVVLVNNKEGLSKLTNCTSELKLLARCPVVTPLSLEFWFLEKCLILSKICIKLIFWALHLSFVANFNEVW